MVGRWSDFRFYDKQMPSTRMQAAIFLSNAQLHLQNTTGPFNTDAGIILMDLINEIAQGGGK
ncbi:hypothetical protein BDD14_0708 [Edaphobacter modestus]|uniref:Uncharacterized protein n=1 Tax=Edaphobacter modestus TaxID=388466 RepID=A0A4Q7YR73_9BACT|nr:hypothetical protein BDD14_0708 [Edaphobacter modestus]